MKNGRLQVDETAINESFDSANNVFDEFREFSSGLFSQIMDLITPMFQNLLNV